jgi:hypothetical protein
VQNVTLQRSRKKFFFGLQFLNPSEVCDSFAFDLVESLGDDDRVQKFRDYLVENDISEDALFLPYIWASETASLSRTTNACESFHSHFSTNFYKAHPNIYQFTEILLNFQGETYVKINTPNKFVKKLRPQVKQRQNLVLEKIKERNENRMSKLHPFSIYTTKSSDFSNFCGVIGYNFFLL